MVHGIAGYFIERASCARRVALLTLGLSMLGGAGLFGVSQTPVFRHNSHRLPSRFGVEGPEQYVRRIDLEQERGHGAALSSIGLIEMKPDYERGGAPRHTRARVGQPEPRPVHDGSAGGAGSTMRSVSRLAGVPVFQSEELIIERLVKPDYPPLLLAREVEGKVTVQALVDTVGQVVDVQVLASTGETQFEQAARDAVLQCRFRPYRRGGEPSEVYAVFRFSFRIY
jgi:TonB family protein